MSKTDNTRSIKLQWSDTTSPGYVQHYHTRSAGRKRPSAIGDFWICSFELVECNNANCHRVAYHYGGKHAMRPRRNPDKQRPSRRMRRQVRQQLRRLPADPWRFDDRLPRQYRYYETVKGLIASQ